MRISDWSSDVCSSDLEREGKPLTIKIRRGAVLATGGFSQNPEMRKQHIPYAEHHISLMPPGNTGDGIRAAMEVGAAMDEGNTQNAAWTVISLYPQRDGSMRRWPHLFLDRPRSEEHTSELQSLMRISYAVFFWTIKATAAPIKATSK